MLCEYLQQYTFSAPVLRNDHAILNTTNYQQQVVMGLPPLHNRGVELTSEKPTDITAQTVSPSVKEVLHFVSH